MSLKTSHSTALFVGLAVFSAFLFMQQDVKAQTLIPSNYNVIALNDLTLTSHIEGRAAVGGNFYVSGGNGEVAQHLTGISTTDRALVVAGQILQKTAGAQFMQDNGSIYVNSVANIPSYTNPQNPGVIKIDYFQTGGGRTIQTPGLSAAQVAAMKITYQNASAYYKNTAANNTATNIGQSQNNPNFNATVANANGQAIFNVSGTALAASAGGVTVTLATTVHDVVINVSGTVINFGNTMSFGGLSNSRTNVLWNFYEATSVTLDTNFAGAILAPYATVTSNNISIDSKVIAYNVNNVGGGEIHNIAYNGPALETVPEPGVASLLGAAALLHLLPRKRKK